MPANDRSGPMGEGPMTGRGAGPCGGGGAFRMGRGWRRHARRGGAGPRRGVFGFFAEGAAPAEGAALKAEAEALRQQQSWLDQRLRSIEGRIAAMEGVSGTDESSQDG